MSHANAPLTRTGRHRMVLAVEDEGLTFEAAAAASNVAKSTVHLWVSRWRAASPAERASLACLEDRSSRPRRSPSKLSTADHDRVCELRRRTGWGPRLIASEVGLPHATVHRALRRRGCSRAPRAPREAVRRYEWPCPGNLLHMDTKRHARFSRPGHAVTGDRTMRSKGAGWEFVHTIVDDCSRLAYAEIHRDERADTVVAFTERALDWFADHGIVAERLLTDNHFSYTQSRALRELFKARSVEHWTTRPYTPRTNGKVERLQRRWTASGRAAWPTARARLVAKRCHTGSTTTTELDATRRSATVHRSLAFGTSWARHLAARAELRLGEARPRSSSVRIPIGEFVHRLTTMLAEPASSSTASSRRGRTRKCSSPAATEWRVVPDRNPSGTAPLRRVAGELDSATGLSYTSDGEAGAA